jgi:hypothetical protein
MAFRTRLLVLAVAALLGPALSASALTLVKDGQPVSAIVIADDATASALAAADELQYHLKKMSGAEVPIITDADAPKDADTTVILIGRSALTDQLGVDYAAIAPEGYIIKTSGNALMIVGDDAGGEGKTAEEVGEPEVRKGSLFGVYGFLQDQLGCRWIWPGPTGEHVPQQAAVEVSDLDVADAPALERRHMRLMMHRDFQDADKLFDRALAKDEMSKQERLWYMRIRMGRHAEGPQGHSFRNFWEKYSATDSDIFALLPSGKRGYAGRPGVVKMCVANPKLWDLLTEQFRAAHANNPNNHALQACEADGRAGHCTCDLCKAFDATQYNLPQDVLDALDQDLYDDLAPQKDGIPGTLSTRYAKFLNEMCRRVKAIDPEGYVTMYAMTRLRETPIGVKMEPNLMVNYVGFNNYPLTPSERAAERRDFTGWITTGTKVVLRPNAPHYAGDGMPYNISREMGDDFQFALDNGLVQAEFDSMLGYWASWGPTHYILPRMMWEGKVRDPETLIAEWYSAFGPAQRPMRAYYDFWEAYIRSKYNDPATEANMVKLSEGFTRGGMRAGRLLGIADVYTPEVLAQARALLDEAQAVDAPESVKHKIANVEMNQTNAELTAKVARLAQAARTDATVVPELDAARTALLEHRRAIATRNAVNVYWETQYEIQNGDPFGWKTLPEFNAAK